MTRIFGRIGTALESACNTHQGLTLRIDATDWRATVMVPADFLASPTALTRFWAKVDKGNPDECWNWTAAKSPLGYGAFHPSKKRTTGAHRFSLEIALGRPLHATMFACHHCDNPSCVNPSHLYEGTHQDNVDDAVSRRRHKHGDMGAGSKLSDSEILAIRERASVGEKNRTLAAEYGVNESLVSMITRGTRWTHIGGPISQKYNKRKAA